MLSTDLHRAAKILQDLSHDLRQSLGTIEVSAYVLNRSLPEEDVQGREHIRAIERQVEAASAMLHEATAAMRRLTDQSDVEASLELTKSATAGLT
jgi:signal transduction histidine kinase